MLNTIKQVFRSPRFLVGFVIFAIILLTVIFYPMFVRADPLAMVGNGNFFKPGYLCKCVRDGNCQQIYPEC